MSDFYDMTTLDSLFMCWLNAKKNKSANGRVQRFAEDPLNYLIKIQDRLRNRAYSFGPYKTFVVREKKWRDVVDAPMKDRVVHWMLYSYLLPIWSKRFIHDTYGNLPGRGTTAAVKRLADFCRKDDAQWVLQVDISKYFYAIPHETLKAKVLRYVGDHDLRNLLSTLIDSFRTGNNYDHLFDLDTLYRRNSAKGMPIGNLTSQLFANVYLNDLDHWIKEVLRVKYYIRYVDDIVILSNSKSELQSLCAKLKDALTELGLTIHPKKIRLAPTASGVPFLGYVVWSTHISAGNRIRSRFHYRLRQHESGVVDCSQALNSYKAALSHTGSTL
ncbi:MAG: RNA-directed DNA polymerase [Methylophilaceae bacterium]